MGASPRGHRAGSTGCGAARRAEWSDTGRCPDAASGVPVGDRRGRTVDHIPDRAIGFLVRGPGGCALLPRSASVRRDPRARDCESPGSEHTVLYLALAHYALTHNNPGWARKIG